MAWCQLSYVLHGWYLIVSAENSLGVSWLEILTGESLQSSDNLHVPFQRSLFEILPQGWWGQTKSLWFPRGMMILAQLVILQEFTQQIKAQINEYWVCGKLEGTHRLWASDRCGYFWLFGVCNSVTNASSSVRVQGCPCPPSACICTCSGPSPPALPTQGSTSLKY